MTQNPSPWSLPKNNESVCPHQGCAHTYTGGLFMAAPTWRQPEHPRKVNGEAVVETSKGTVLIGCMHEPIRDILVREKSQTLESSYCMIPLRNKPAHFWAPAREHTKLQTSHIRKAGPEHRKALHTHRVPASPSSDQGQGAHHPFSLGVFTSAVAVVPNHPEFSCEH